MAQNTFPTPSGNVGIGTSTPSVLLDVKSAATGDVELARFSNPNIGVGSYGYAVFGGADAAGSGVFLGFKKNGTGTGIATFGVRGSGSSLSIDQAGSVGIGTSSPSYLLHVNGQAKANSLVVSNPSYAGQLSFGSSANYEPGIASDTNFLFTAGNGASLIYKINTTEAMRVNASGNVGIGSSNPIDRLQITNPGDVRVVLMPNGGANNRESLIDYWSTFDSYPADSAPRRVARVQAGFGGAQWGTEYMAFGVGGAGDAATPPTERMRIDGFGNVGIGTTNPTHKLAVAGTIRAQEVIVDTGWSDYVFDESYQLSALSEVEQHIKSDKHLPGIPSAKQVAANGISLGEMQAKLLAKIEELTLHQIAQEKRLQAQDAKIEDQAKAIRMLVATNERLIAELSHQ